jgi:hypothetical protein
MSYENHHLLFLQFDQNHFQKHFSGVDTTPRFSETFFKFSLSVPSPRVLAPPEGLSRALLLTNKPLLRGNGMGKSRGHLDG